MRNSLPFLIIYIKAQMLPTFPKIFLRQAFSHNCDGEVIANVHEAEAVTQNHTPLLETLDYHMAPTVYPG